MIAIERNIHRVSSEIHTPSMNIRVLRLQPVIKQQKHTPVVLLGGWALSSRAYEDFGQGLAEQGREVVFFDYSFKKRPRIRRNSSQIAEEEALQAVLQANDFHTIDILAHSRGAKPAVDFALHHPDTVKGIVLVSPAGLTDNSTLQVTTRFGIDAFWDLIRTLPYRKQALRAWRAGVLALIGVIKNPLYALSQVREMQQKPLPIPSIKKLGVKVGIITSSNDMVFTPKEITTKAKGLGLTEFTRTIVGKHSRHNSIVITPESYARATGDLFDKLESN